MPLEKQHEFLSACESQIDKLDFLMQTMIKTSRLETGMISLNEKNQPIYDTLAVALGGILINAEKKYIKIHINCPEHLEVSHDSKWISEALFNILDNAVKYTPTHGSIYIATISNENYFKIIITDTGIGMSDEEFERALPNIIKSLDLGEHIDKITREMSGGNMRKISIGVALLSNSELVMLDEPTSSLDPIARYNVHQLLAAFKGRKTFVLCTHLLNEAESLCDNIAILIKGCVFTYGSPQHLTNHFGKDWKIDLLLEDMSKNESVDTFLRENVPSAKLTFERNRTRIYSVPSDTIPLPDLFDTLQKGVDQKCGISYYTASSSTLEKVFMELVKMADSNQEEAAAQ